MGNLIKDFWRYTYTRKDGVTTDYFGRIDTIAGKDLSKKRNENYIETALKYTMQHKILSHMSIQTFTRSLQDAPCRNENEQKYYPFIVEFEPQYMSYSEQLEKYDEVLGECIGSSYEETIEDVVKYIDYLENRLNINEKDILIMINNHKSIYVFVNPKTLGVKPEVELSKIYYEMYEKIKAKTGIRNVDESIVKANYKLMKTPNCYYKGGFFVRIDKTELLMLLDGEVSKEELTRERRTLDIEVPGALSLNAARAYTLAREKVLKKKREYEKEDCKTECTSCKGCGKCIEYMMQTNIEKGYRHEALVSLTLSFKNQAGFTREDTENNVIQFAEAWKHDEKERQVLAKVRWAYKHEERFSCEYVRKTFRDILNIESLCKNCQYHSKTAIVGETIQIDRGIIEDLWDNKASLRHYKMYLELESKDLFNKRIDPKEHDINIRTLKEMIAKVRQLKLITGADKCFRIDFERTDKVYRLPKTFCEETINELGESLKQYLRIIVTGFKAAERYVIVKASRTKLEKLLNYTNKTSLYKFISKLERVGLIKEHKDSKTLTLYYTSYKVININDTEVEQEEPVQIKVASGEQISFEKVSKSWEINCNNFQKNIIKNNGVFESKVAAAMSSKTDEVVNDIYKKTEYSEKNNNYYKRIITKRNRNGSGAENQKKQSRKAEIRGENFRCKIVHLDEKKE